MHFFHTRLSFSQIVAICYVEVEYLRPPISPFTRLVKHAEVDGENMLGWICQSTFYILHSTLYIQHLHLHFEASDLCPAIDTKFFACQPDELTVYLGVALRLTKLTLSSLA